jgi:hypothetical protein
MAAQWTQEEMAKLKELVEIYGRRWKKVVQQLLLWDGSKRKFTENGVRVHFEKLEKHSGIDIFCSKLEL